MPKAVKTVPWNKIKAEYLQGAAPRELAAKYKLTAKCITNKASAEKWSNEKKIISENLRQNTEEKIKKLTNSALDALEEVLSNPDCKAAEKISAAKVVLDISGLKNARLEEKAELPVIQTNGVKI